MKKKRILITGLCLSRNRGGPAMALSFMNQLKPFLNAEFVFAVDPNYLELERLWGKKYGVQVVPRDTILHWVLTRPLISRLWRLRHCLTEKKRHMKGDVRLWISAHKHYRAAFQRADCVINLNGITFVGDGSRSWLISLADRTCSIYSKRYEKPFCRFIQSYGPMEDRRVRMIARREFRRLPFIMARGELSATYCREINGDTPVYSYPDVAITLSCADRAWLNDYLTTYHLEIGKYIVLSPSAVIASMPAKKDSSLGFRHIDFYAGIAEHYLSSGKHILFVPHMTSPDQEECDRHVCTQVLHRIRNRGHAHSQCDVLKNELDCHQMKSLISGAELAIVSRYHALVAALSTGVPAVAIGWNDKYKDILKFYGSDECCVDARRGEPESSIRFAIEKAGAWSPEKRETLIQYQPLLERMVGNAAKICAEWILDVTKP